MGANRLLQANAKAPAGEPVPHELIVAAIPNWAYRGQRTYERLYAEPKGTFVTTAAMGFALTIGGSIDLAGERYQEVIELNHTLEWDDNVQPPEAGAIVMGILWDGSSYDFGPYRVYESTGGLRVSRIWHTSFPLGRLRIIGRVVRQTLSYSALGVGLRCEAPPPVYDALDLPSSKAERLRSGAKPTEEEEKVAA